MNKFIYKLKNFDFRQIFILDRCNIKCEEILDE